MAQNTNMPNTQQLTLSTPFPDPRRYCVAMLVINTAGLPSAEFDAENLARLFGAYLRFNELWVIFDNASANAKHKSNIEAMGKQSQTAVRLSSASSAHELLATITAWVEPLSPEVDFVLELSSHGFYDSRWKRNFIVWGSTTIYDNMFHKAMVDALHPMARCLCLIDSCASGTFMVLNYQSLDAQTYLPESHVLDQQHPNVVCISAVENNQSDLDDLCDLKDPKIGCWGGGLSCGYIDYVVQNHENQAKGIEPLASIGGFFHHYRNRIAITGRSPVLSFNDLHFLTPSSEL